MYVHVICCALGTTSIFLSQQVISDMRYVNNEKSKISMVSHKEISECEHDSPCLLEFKYIWSIHEHAYSLSTFYILCYYIISFTGFQYANT